MKLTVYLVIFLSMAVSAQEQLPDLKIEKIAKGVFLHQSYQLTERWGLVSSNGLVVIDNLNAHIIDTPWSEADTEKLVLWIEKQGYKTVSSISTHFHEDRSAGISWLNSKSISTYASKLTNKLLKNDGKVQAIHSFKGNEFWMVNDLIKAYHPGAGHSVDNIVVWLPKSQILYGGCLVRSLQSKTLGNTADAKVEQWATSVDDVIVKFPQLKTVIPGHGKPGDLELLKHTRDLADKHRKSRN